MEMLVAQGKIRFIGVSNFDVEMLKLAQGALRKERLACNQVLYHLGDRGIEQRLIPYCAEHEIAVVGYSPFGHSSFPLPQSVGGQLLIQIGKRNGRTVRQVALNFLTRHPAVFSIPKAGRVDHVRENSGGTGWDLSNHDDWALKQVFPAPDYDYLEISRWS